MPESVGVARKGIASKVQGLMSAVNNAAAKQAVLDALTDAALDKINFKIKSFAISPQLYAKVKEKVNSGAITVVYNGTLRNPRTGLPFCVYRPDTNVMTLGFNSASGMNERALVIHEATHAACDVANYSAMITVESEAMAYVAQAIFLTVKLGTLPLQADQIIANSQLLAQIVLNGRALTAADLISISNAISTHPDYVGKAIQRVGYDGVN